MVSRHRSDSPQVQVQQRILTQVHARIRTMISQELVHRTLGNDLELDIVVDHATQNLVLELQKSITVDRLRTDTEDVEVWLDVPWEYEVLIDPEPRWWHRFHRPAARWVTVHGRVKRRGTVKIKVDHLMHFPETTWAWPETMGRPVRVQEVTILEDPRWTEQIPHVADRPWAAESGVLRT